MLKRKIQTSLDEALIPTRRSEARSVRTRLGLGNQVLAARADPLTVITRPQEIGRAHV